VERETHLESMIEKRCGLESFYDQRVTCRAQGPWVTERRGCWISETVIPRHVDGVWHRTTFRSAIDHNLICD
jgi:hypothetical protein